MGRSLLKNNQKLHKKTQYFLELSHCSWLKDIINERKVILRNSTVTFLEENPTRINPNGFVLDTGRYKSCIVLVRPLAIDENSIRNTKFLSRTKICSECLNSKKSVWVNWFKRINEHHNAETNRVISCKPITNHNENISFRLCKRNWDNVPIINNKWTKPTRSFLKIDWWEVKETPNLILHLKLVGPIPLWRNWTVGAKNTILPRIPPHLNPRPAIIHPLSAYNNSKKMNIKSIENLFSSRQTKSLEDFRPDHSIHLQQHCN